MVVWPRGDEIRSQLGSRYFLLPVPDSSIWHCEWCRRRRGTKTVEEIETVVWRKFIEEHPMNPPLSESARPPLRALTCEMETLNLWPSDVRGDATLDAQLPQPTLPDGRWVICIPPTKSFGNILPAEWRRIVDGARAARGPLLLHAYERTLENLQEWKETGRDLLRRFDERVALTKRNVDLTAENDPFPDINRHAPLMSWIEQWAWELSATDYPDFVPFEWARKLLSRTTGLADRTVEKIVGRHRADAPGVARPERAIRRR